MSFVPCSTVVGVFDRRSDANEAIDDLVRAGFRNDQIGVVTSDSQRPTSTTTDEAETRAAESGVAGAIAGAGIGGLVGLGVLAGAIPVIGPAIAAGTLATILTNAAGGAAIIGIAGALMGWGVPEEHARFYEEEVYAGRIVVTVHAEDRCPAARSIMESHGGYSYESVGSTVAHM